MHSGQHMLLLQCFIIQSNGSSNGCGSCYFAGNMWHCLNIFSNVLVMVTFCHFFVNSVSFWFLIKDQILLMRLFLLFREQQSLWLINPLLGKITCYRVAGVYSESKMLLLLKKLLKMSVSKKKGLQSKRYV